MADAVTPTSEEIQQALKRLISCPRFAGSERLCRFLRFIVATALDGRASEIKEMSVAMEVYGRGDSYDPQTDSIVRVEASRLRGKLREYYLDEGKDEAVRIALPRGGYAPVFERCEPAAPVAEPSAPAITTAVEKLPIRRRLPGGAWLWAAAGLLSVGASGWYLWGRLSPGGPVIDSIAVLPFVSLSAGGSDDRFADGMTEDITTELSHLPKVSVPGRTTMFQYKGRAVDISQVGRLAKVDAVLEGSIRHEGDRFLITAQLINVADGYHLWAETYERKNTDGFAVQREVSATLARAIGARTSGRTPWHGSSGPPVHPAAIEAYSRALDLLNRDFVLRRNEGALPAELRHAIEYLEEAIRISPGFARAWTALAGAFERSIDMEPRGPSTAKIIKRAEQTALRAIELEPTQAEAHAVLGSIRLYRLWDWDGAEQALRRAIELDPRHAQPPREYSDLLRLRGRTEEALTEILRVEKLAPESDALPTQKAILYYSAGRLEDAMAEAAKALAARSDSREAHWIVGLCLQEQGKLSAAEARFRQILTMAPKDGRALPALGNVLGLQGKGAEAQKIADEMVGLSQKGGGMEYPSALVYAGMGDTTRAFQWLEAALDKHDPSVMYLRVEPRLRRLQADPRFQALLERLRL